MLDQWIDEFEALRRAKAVVLLKWDGERAAQPYTFVLTRQETDFVFRRDADDLSAAIAEGIASFRAAHPDHVTLSSPRTSGGAG